MASHEAMTFERADQLRDELKGYEADTQLLDGQTAAQSLAAVLKAPKRFEQVIVFNGQDYRRRLDDEALQHTLFEMEEVA